jgi:peptidoglycan/LPS O-acetylase OafA/YrhL
MVATQNSFSLFKNKLLAYIGRNSYGIYLWHGFVNQYLMKYLPASSSVLNYSVYIICYITIAIIFGVAATKLIEYPFLRIREKHFPANSSSVPIAEVIDEPV